jgi:hypothetical protein
MYKILVLLICVNASLGIAIDFKNLHDIVQQHKTEAQLFFESISLIGKQKFGNTLSAIA